MFFFVSREETIKNELLLKKEARGLPDLTLSLIQYFKSEQQPLARQSFSRIFDLFCAWDRYRKAETALRVRGAQRVEPAPEGTRPT